MKAKSKKTVKTKEREDPGKNEADKDGPIGNKDDLDDARGGGRKKAGAKKKGKKKGR